MIMVLGDNTYADSIHRRQCYIRGESSLQYSHKILPIILYISLSTTHLKKYSSFLSLQDPNQKSHTIRIMDSFKICDFILQVSCQQCSVILCHSLGSTWNSLRQVLLVSLLFLTLHLLPPFNYASPLIIIHDFFFLIEDPHLPTTKFTGYLILQYLFLLAFCNSGKSIPPSLKGPCLYFCLLEIYL